MRCPPVIGLLVALALPAHAAEPLMIWTVFGTGRPEDNGRNGAADQTNVGDPFGVQIGPDGALYVTEVRNHRVWRVDLEGGQAAVVAGSGQVGYSGDGGPATEARLNEPYEVRFDRQGNMILVEMQNHLVRMVDRATGRISTLAGSPTAGFRGDGGTAGQAQFRQPHSIALDDEGGLWIADIGNHRIRHVALPSAMIRTAAGNGQARMPQPGQPAVDHPLLGPRALWISGQSVWIALREGHSIWRLDRTTGRLTPIAGTAEPGWRDVPRGGQLRDARFNGPKGICLDSQGRIVVADTENHAIRRIDLQAGTVETLAGLGPDESGFSGDGGDATQARLNRPHGVYVAPDGTVYVGDTLNHRVRAIGAR